MNSTLSEPTEGEAMVGLRCDRCGVRRPSAEMRWVGSLLACDPDNDHGVTCAMHLADRGYGVLDERPF